MIRINSIQQNYAKTNLEKNQVSFGNRKSEQSKLLKEAAQNLNYYVGLKQKCSSIYYTLCKEQGIPDLIKHWANKVAELS